MEDQDLWFDDEPMSWTRPELDRLLLWAAQAGASDVQIVPGRPVWMRLHGAWRAITRLPVQAAELPFLVDQITRDSAGSAKIDGGEYIDFGYEVQEMRGVKRRFRGNATACTDGRGFGRGISVVLRSIPSAPPCLEDLDVEPELLQAMFPLSGLVLVTGTMGSGKSTLLAAALRHSLERYPRSIGTYEAPVEFDLTAVENPKAPLTQSEIPLHLRRWETAPRNATRRATDIVLVGESRDEETLHGMIEMAELGPAVYSTVHTRSVADTPGRILNVFGADLQRQVAGTLLSCLKLVIQQRLVPGAEGGRVALREFLVFSRSIRDQLFGVLTSDGVSGLTPALQTIVEDQGQPLIVDAGRKLEAGLIDADVYKVIEQEALSYALA